MTAKDALAPLIDSIQKVADACTEGSVEAAYFRSRLATARNELTTARSGG